MHKQQLAALKAQLATLQHGLPANANDISGAIGPASPGGDQQRPPLGHSQDRERHTHGTLLLLLESVCALVLAIINEAQTPCQICPYRPLLAEWT